MTSANDNHLPPWEDDPESVRLTGELMEKIRERVPEHERTPFFINVSPGTTAYELIQEAAATPHMENLMDQIRRLMLEDPVRFGREVRMAKHEQERAKRGGWRTRE